MDFIRVFSTILLKHINQQDREIVKQKKLIVEKNVTQSQGDDKTSINVPTPPLPRKVGENKSNATQLSGKRTRYFPQSMVDYILK